MCDFLIYSVVFRWCFKVFKSLVLVEELREGFFRGVDS